MSTQAIPKNFWSPASPLLFDEFKLESGEMLKNVKVAYETWGRLNAQGDNAVLVCHALTGNAHAASHPGILGDEPGWWEGLIGHGNPLDPGRHFIVCANVLGGCSGTMGPGSQNPETGFPYGPVFPQITTRDMVNLQKRLLEELGVSRLALVVGGSLGALQAWQWAVDHPDFVEAAAPIAGSLQCSPWVIALNTVARQAILTDPSWNGGNYQTDGPATGLALARMIAMISYRTESLFWDRFGREREDCEADGNGLGAPFQVERYLRHHGSKIVQRFDARSYVTLTRAMDLHDVSWGYESLDAAVDRIRSRILLIGIDSDVLFPVRELRLAAHCLRERHQEIEYREIQSDFGHDAFLAEADKISEIIGGWFR